MGDNLKEAKYTHKQYYIIFAAIFLGFGVIVALLTSLINYNIKYMDIENQLETRGKSEYDFRSQYLSGYIKDVELVISSIASNPLMEKYISTEDETDRENLSNLFYSLTYSNKDLMQLRFLDASGMEKVRIDRDKASPTLKVVPLSEMQDKSDRYYFKDTMQILDGTFWHSKVDLNIEHGQIEKPIKPTFRVAAPLILANRVQGILIANVLMDNLLNVITSSDNFNIYLVDGDGEVIINPDDSKSWSRYLPDRPGIRNIFPGNAESILSNSSIMENGFYLFSMAKYFRNGEGIRMIMIPKEEVLGKLKKNNTLTALLIAAIVLFVSVPLSWMASYFPSRLQSSLLRAFKDIRRYNDIIDRNIMTSKADREGVITEVSSKFLEITGYTREEVIGKNHNILKHPDTKEETYRELWKTILSGLVWSAEVRDLDKQGREFWILQSITPEFDDNGVITGFTSIAQDITDKKKIEQMSVTDKLTGLFNRHRLDEILENEMNRFSRYRADFSAILLDVDHFKKVNDTYGHQTGDEVLAKIAEIMRDNTRVTDFAGRWGGEEFLIIAVQSDLSSACALAEKIREKIASAVFGKAGSVTASFGVAQYKAGETAAHFINRADDALYVSKDGGRNKVSCANGPCENKDA